MRRRAQPGGFVVTVEFLLVMGLFVMPLLVGLVLLGRKAATLYFNSVNYTEAPEQQAIVVDSSPAATPKVMGPVVGYDPFEAPLVIFREHSKQGGVVLGVRPTRVTSYAEVFYDDDACTVNPRVRKANESTSSSSSDGNIPAGFLYQDHHLAAAMGSGNKLWVDSVAYASLMSPQAPSGLLAVAQELWGDVREQIDSLRVRAIQAYARSAGVMTTLVARLRNTIAPSVTAAVGDYYVYTGHTGAQTQIDTNHTTSWYIRTGGSPVLFGGAYLTMKIGKSTTADIVLAIRANGPGGAVLATKTLSPSAFSTSFTGTLFEMSDGSANTAYSLSANSTYYVSLSSSAPDVQSQAYFIKGGNCLAARPASLSGTWTCVSMPVASSAAALATGSFTIAKSATATVQQGGTFSYSLTLGNDGGATTGTTATISEQLPAGITATGVTAGTNVTSVSCGMLPSASGASLSCSVTLTAGIPASTGSGASFTLTVEAGMLGDTTVTNYVSVDSSGGMSPPTPGPTCTTPDCASASTMVTTAAAPASLEILKAATATANAGGTITYTFTVRNTGGTDYTDTVSAITVQDQLPAGVVVTAVTSGSNTASASCGMLPSAAGALLTCGVTPSNALLAGSANSLVFTMTATAPLSSGTYSNYVSIDPDGSGMTYSAATPGSSCALLSCSSASTAVSAGYVWRSQSVAPPTMTAPSPPCYQITSLPPDLVQGTQLIDFDDSATNYTLPFRVFFRTLTPPPTALGGSE